MAYEAQIEAGKKVIAAYQASKAAEAKVVTWLGSIQRSAQKGKAASRTQLTGLAQAHDESVKADAEAQRQIQSFANNYLE
jgi:xylose isomerase